MSRVVALVLLLSVMPDGLAGQALAVLHIRVVFADVSGRSIPVARHALLISDNPPTRETRRVLTGLDGTIDVRLPPGNYTVESDQPVAFEGKTYHWTQIVDVTPGRDSTLDLTLANAVAEPLSGDTSAGPPSSTDPRISLRAWLDSVVEVWTPTAHGSGFLVDAAGLIVTTQAIVGDAAAVEIQLARAMKVAGTVVRADRAQDLAVIRIDPTVMAAIAPVPLGCPRNVAAPVERSQELYVITAPPGLPKGVSRGEASRVAARFINTDFRLAAGALGGPAFTSGGEFAGITAPLDARDEPSRGAARVARVPDACDLVAAAAKAPVAAPTAARLPVEPAVPAPVAAFKEAVRRRAGSLKPYPLAASDFDVAFITPILNYAAQAQGRERFGNWTEYAADIPPVLFVRATPKKAESLWAKVARGAAYTQGMALPALTRVKSGLDRLQAFCDGVEVAPIHPFKLELQVSETEAVYEGLYAFDPAALGPQCQTVAIVLYSEKEPGKADRRVIDPGTLQQIRRDFAVGATP